MRSPSGRPGTLLRHNTAREFGVLMAHPDKSAAWAGVSTSLVSTALLASVPVADLVLVMGSS